MSFQGKLIARRRLYFSPLSRLASAFLMTGVLAACDCLNVYQDTPIEIAGSLPSRSATGAFKADSLAPAQIDGLQLSRSGMEIIPARVGDLAVPFKGQVFFWINYDVEGREGGAIGEVASLEVRDGRFSIHYANEVGFKTTGRLDITPHLQLGRNEIVFTGAIAKTPYVESKVSRTAKGSKLGEIMHQCFESESGPRLIREVYIIDYQGP